MRRKIALAAIFGAAWLSPDGPALAQLLPLGSEFQVNTYMTDYQRFSAVAVDGTGNFVVVWQSTGQDAPGNDGVFGQRFDGNGLPLGAEFPVNTSRADPRWLPTRPATSS